MGDANEAEPAALDSPMPDADGYDPVLDGILSFQEAIAAIRSDFERQRKNRPHLTPEQYIAEKGAKWAGTAEAHER